MLSPDITGLPCQSPLLEQGWGPSSGPGDHPIGSPTGPGDPFLGGLQPDHLISLPGATEHLPGLREAHCALETAAQEDYSLPVEVDYGNNFILDTTVHNELSVPRPISLERTLLKEDFVSNNSSMSREQRIPAISNLYSHSPSEDVVNESTDQFKSSTVPDSTVSSHQTYSTIVNNNEPPTNDGNPFNFHRGVSLNYKRLVSGCTQTSQPGTPIHFQRSSSLIERSRPVSLISGCTQTDIETENSWAFCRSPSLDQYYDAFEIPSPSRTPCLVQGEPDWSPPEQHSSAENSIPCTTDNVIPREWLKREDVPSHSEQCVMETLAIQNTDCIVGSPDGHLMETTVLHHNENTPWTPRTLDDDCVQDWVVKNSSSVGEEHSIPSSSRGLEDTEQLMSLPRGRCLTPGVSDSDEDDEDDEDDPDVKQRLAELASVLAESLGRRCSEENMGCKVNLAFDDTESTEECRGIDITDPDCDNQPWYFGRAQEPDWEAVPSDRPVSLACTSPPEFLRNCTTRATVGDRPHSLVALSRSQKVRSTLAGLPRRSREVLAQDMRVLKKLARRVSWASHHGETRQSGGSWQDEEDEEVDWSWVQDELRLISHREEEDARGQLAASTTTEAECPPSHRASWLRASMRRVSHFRLGEPPGRVCSAPPGPLPPLPPLGPPPPVHSSTRRPHTQHQDFPRRYSAGVVQHVTVSATNSPGRHSQSSAVSSASTESSVGVSSSDETSPRPAATRPPVTSRSCNNSSDANMSDSVHNQLGHWPHNLSSMLASLGCTLGLCNISRFAVLSIHFGANFIVQFLFLSLVFGIPLYCFHASLGQHLTAGVMDMWKISPVFQGIGIALLVSQALIGIYSIVGVSWMFIYFRDSFITKLDRYRWAEPYELYREDSRPLNGTYKLEETVPDYLNGVVLQRHNLATPESTFGHLKFQVTFNLAVVWMIVFVCLSKGLKSYGKVVYVFSLLPVFGMLVLCTKLLGLTPTNPSHQVFPETDWSEFFLNTKCWVAATTEAFLTWGLLGAALMQISSHNKNKHLLNRDASLVIVLTLSVLMLAAFLANTCVQLLKTGGYTYMPSSFEHMSSYSFLHSDRSSSPIHLTSTPVRFMGHSQFVVGSQVVQPGANSAQQSGYQALRLATEIVPATLALLGSGQASPFWAVLFYFTLILFGIAQQLCIWHCVITGIMAINVSSLKAWETTITFFSCACGFILGLPMTTELGIFVVYFLDYCVGSAWWIMILYLLEIAAVLFVRGRPYTGDVIVTALLPPETSCLTMWATPMLVFNWNVALPVGLMVLCITVFKNAQLRDLYSWHHLSYDYWPLWAREAGCLVQLVPILTVPFAIIIQSCRYLSAGPPDLFDRISLLYRPSQETVSEIRNDPELSPTAASPSTASTVIPHIGADPVLDDPPPKYTPPPSYTTATGARIAKMLRQSFRRSVRRIASVLGEHSNSVRPTIAISPPDYAAVLVEINQALQDRDTQRVTSPTEVSVTVTDSAANTNNRQSTMTAADVAHILRSSLRRTVRRGAMAGPSESNDIKTHSTTVIADGR